MTFAGEGLASSVMLFKNEEEKMFEINEKTRRLIFRLIIFAVFAYLAFIMFSYYTSDRVGMVKLSYKTSEANIVTSAYATYKMKTDEGALLLTQDNDLSLAEPQNAVSYPIILSSDGKLVSEVVLEIEYDDKNIDEASLSVVKLNSDNTFDKCDYISDTKENIIKLNVSGDGIWYVTIG